MIKKILLFFSIVSSTISVAQDPELVDIQWYLDKLVISGEENFPPVNEELLNVPLFFEDNGFGPDFVSNVCDQLYGESLTFETGSFSIETLIQSLGGCFNIDNKPFQSLYFQFYFANSMTNPYSYEITNDGNGGKSMTITNINGDVAYYQNSVLAIPNKEVYKVALYPIPTSEVVNIESEKTIDKVQISSVSGSLVASLKNPSKAINVSYLPSGIYFVEIIAGDQRSIQKLIKE